MENKITNEEIKLFNQHFKIRQTYAIQYLEEVPELPSDFQQNKYMEDLGFYDENFNSTVISDSGRYYIYSKSSGEEHLIDDISDIAGPSLISITPATPLGSQSRLRLPTSTVKNGSYSKTQKPTTEPNAHNVGAWWLLKQPM